MPEISSLADIFSVFRNGKHIETFPMSSRTTEEIVPMMIGREVARAYPKKYESSTPSTKSTSVHSVHSRTTPKTRIGEVAATSVVSSPNQTAPLLEIRDITWYNLLKAISIRLAPRAIVALGGLHGRRHTE